jgi:hypothetical protein
MIWGGRVRAFHITCPSIIPSSGSGTETTCGSESETEIPMSADHVIRFLH